MNVNMPGAVGTTRQIQQTGAAATTTATQLDATTTQLNQTQDAAAQLQIGDGDFNAGDASAEELIAQRDKIQKLIDDLTKEAEALEKTLDAQNQEIEQLNIEYKKETDKLNDLEEQFEEKQKQLDSLNEDIAYAQDAEQRRFDNKISDITSAAINNYDPEKDGDDFEAYLDKQLSGAGFGNYSAVDSLNSKALQLADETNSLLGAIKKQANTVRTLADTITEKQKIAAETKNKIDAKNGEIQTSSTELQTVKTQLNKLTGAGLTGTEVLAQISDAEKQLVKDNNIDLTEKLEDGSPKYVAAKGADDKFHFYQMPDGASLARQFGNNTGGLRGSDVVPSGSGYMRGITDVDDGQGRAVYSFSEVNECLDEGCAESTQKCYTTCSPLSFDINGDGIHTTASTMKYDIDGDGVLDTINNSAEWVLAFDKDGDGIAGEDGSELFGDNTDLDGDGKKDGYANGFEALKALARKENLIDGVNDNKLDANDLKYLQEKYGLVMTNGYGGEAKSLADLGVTEINLAQTNDTKLTKNFDGRHNNIMTQEGATFKVNGQTREYADIWNAKLDDATGTNYLPGSNLNVASADLDIALDFLDKADNFTEVRADVREVDYETAVIENKLAATANAPKKTEEVSEEQPAVEEADVEQEDNDFVNFQRKRAK